MQKIDFLSIGNKSFCVLSLLCHFWVKSVLDRVCGCVNYNNFFSRFPIDSKEYGANLCKCSEMEIKMKGIVRL